MRNVLYFPFLAPEEDWLRFASLMWDKVYTLGPPAPDPWPDEIQRLDDALDGILKPQRLDLEAYDLWGSNLQWIEDLRPNNVPEVESDSEVVGTPEAGAVFDPIYADKFTESLLGILLERGIARRASPSGKTTARRELIYLPREVAHYYFSACAGNFSRREKCDLFADYEACASVAIAGRATLSAGVTTTLMYAHLPKTVTTLPLKDLASIRRELILERLALQGEIEKVVDSLARVSNESDIRDLEQVVVKLAEKQIQRTDSIYRRARAGTVAKSLAVASLTPGSVTCLASMLGASVFTPAALIAGAALIAATFLIESSKAKDEFSANGWSYFSQVARRSPSTAMIEAAPRSRGGPRRK